MVSVGRLSSLPKIKNYFSTSLRKLAISARLAPFVKSQRRSDRNGSDSQLAEKKSLEATPMLEHRQLPDLLSRASREIAAITMPSSSSARASTTPGSTTSE